MQALHGPPPRSKTNYPAAWYLPWSAESLHRLALPRRLLRQEDEHNEQLKLYESLEMYNFLKLHEFLEIRESFETYESIKIHESFELYESLEIR